MSAVENITGTSGSVTQLSDLGFQSNGQDNTIALSSSSTLTSVLTSQSQRHQGACFPIPPKVWRRR